MIKLLNNLKIASKLISSFICIAAFTGVKYEKDAEFVNNIASDIYNSSEQMKEVINQINFALGSLSDTAAESAASSEEILVSINEITLAVNEVAKSSQSQAETAQNLSGLSQKFII